MEKILGNLKTGVVFVVSAPAGTGKTTLVRMLLDEFSCISVSISCTTRPMRPGEIQNKDYHFISREEFEEKITEDEFLEYATVFGHYYGTLREDIEKEKRKGNHVILVIDTQGALNLIKKNFPSVFIFISPPSLAELRERLFKRKTENQEDIDQRLIWAQKEITLSEHYHYRIINDNLFRAYEILRSILIAEEHKKERHETIRINE